MLRKSNIIMVLLVIVFSLLSVNNCNAKEVNLSRVGVRELFPTFDKVHRLNYIGGGVGEITEINVTIPPKSIKKVKFFIRCCDGIPHVPTYVGIISDPINTIRYYSPNSQSLKIKKNTGYVLEVAIMNYSQEEEVKTLKVVTNSSGDPGAIFFMNFFYKEETIFE